jgi:hypothetical protein
MDLLSSLPLDVRKVLYVRYELAGRLGMVARRYREETRGTVGAWRAVLPVTSEEVLAYMRRSLREGVDDSLEFSLTYTLQTAEEAIPLQVEERARSRHVGSDAESGRGHAQEARRYQGEVALSRDDTLRVLRRRGLPAGEAEAAYQRLLRRQLDRSMAGMFCDVQAWVGRRLLPGTLTPDESSPWSEEERSSNRDRLVCHASALLPHLALDAVSLHVRMLVGKLLGHTVVLQPGFPDDLVMRAYSSLAVLERVYLSARYTMRVLDQATSSLGRTVIAESEGRTERPPPPPGVCERLVLIANLVQWYGSTVIRLSGVRYCREARVTDYAVYSYSRSVAPVWTY